MTINALGLTRTSAAAHRAAPSPSALRARMVPARGSLALAVFSVGLALCALGYAVVAWLVLRVVLSLLV